MKTFWKRWVLNLQCILITSCYLLWSHCLRKRTVLISTAPWLDGLPCEPMTPERRPFLELGKIFLGADCIELSRFKIQSSWGRIISECNPKNASGNFWYHWLGGKLPCQGDPPETSRFEGPATCKKVQRFKGPTPRGWNLIFNPNMLKNMATSLFKDGCTFPTALKSPNL